MEEQDRGERSEVVTPEWTDDQRDAAWAEFGRRIGVPMRLLPACHRRGKSTPTLERAREYVAEDFRHGRCLVLTGPTGIGKSYAAAGTLRATSNTLTWTGARAFLYYPALCGELLTPERRVGALERAKTCWFVVFDDFGMEYVKEGGLVEAFLDEIIWSREAAELPTIITTNLTSEQLRQRLPARLIDRLRGDWGRIFECPGESLR